MNLDGILQPNRSSTIRRIREVIESHDVQRLDIAVAYITASGLSLLMDHIDACERKGHSLSRIRWITSFDYLRSDPVALSEIVAMDRRRIRVHGARAALNRKCVPSRPFHPKLFLFDSDAASSVVVGSGNLSFSGLSRGVEAGLSVTIPKAQPIDQSGFSTIRSFNNWYRDLWRDADPLSDDILSRYRDLYDSAQNLKSPATNEDDVLPPSEGNTGLSLSDLSKIRSSRRYWVVTKNVTKNRGPHLSGNQLMLKRMSRVFFGCPAQDVPRDTQLRDLLIKFADQTPKQCTLSFSNNGMDKITLPIPDNGGPPSYDNSCILFERKTTSLFAIDLLSKKETKRVMAASKKIDAIYEMKGGRKWGVF